MCEIFIEKNLSEVKILFMIINFNSFNNYFKFLKCYNPSSYILLKLFFFKKWSEQLVIFLFIYFFYIKETNLCVLLSTNHIKWLYPFFFFSKHKQFSENRFLKLFKDLFIQELNLLTTEIEIEMWKKQKNKKLLDSYYSIFYLYKIIFKNSIKRKFQIITFNLSATDKINIIKWKNITGLAKKYNINLDFYNISKKDNQFFHYGAYKTKGIYCKPKFNLEKLVIQKHFINCLISLYFFSISMRQFILLPLATKSIDRLQSKSMKNKSYFVCSYCFSILSTYPPHCFVCGLKISNTN